MSEVVKIPGTEIERAAANVIEHAGKNIADGATGFGSIVFNGIIGDRVREWRTRNLIRGAAKTAEILKENGVDLESARSLPMLEFYSIFEGMSAQDDPDVADLWAGLLTSRMLPDQGRNLDKAIPQTLAYLNGSEARVLKFLHAYGAVEAEIAKLRAPIYFGTPVGKEEEAAEAQATNEWLIDERIRRVTALRNEVFGGETPEHYDAATETLTNKRLIYALGDYKRHESFTRREYLDSFRPVETLDSRKVRDALQELNRETLGVSYGNNDHPVRLFGEFQGVSVNYGLTKSASYLLKCCGERKA